MVLVHDVSTVTGRPGNDTVLAFTRLLRPDRKLDRLIQRLDQTAELANIGKHPAVQRRPRLAGNQHHLADQHTRIGDQRPARLDDDFRQFVSEILVQEPRNLLRVHPQLIGPGDVVRRKAATHVDHLQFDAILFLQALENDLDLVQGRIPGTDLALLGTHVEGHAVGHQSQVPGQDQQIHRHVRLTAELP